jgi:two-component system chemotaxis response regulator CheB
MPVDLVVVGTSLGGLSALERLLRDLPADFAAPIAIVQHRQTESDVLLLRALQQRSRLAVEEVEDHTPLAAGRVYLAPPDYHLLVDAGHLALSTEGRVQHARPSIDVLFMSAADTYGAGVVAVVLTGASRDGADGAAHVKLRGGVVIAQSPATADSPVMPQAVISAGAADHILPLDEIAPFLSARVRGG